MTNAVDANKEAAAELDAAQVTFDLDELIVDDDESFDEEVPLEGKYLNKMVFPIMLSPM